jgi:hypothetical protein
VLPEQRCLARAGGATGGWILQPLEPTLLPGITQQPTGRGGEATGATAPCTAPHDTGAIRRAASTAAVSTRPEVWALLAARRTQDGKELAPRPASHPPTTFSCVCRRPHAESSSGGPWTGCAMAGGDELKAARRLNLDLGASALAWLGSWATKSYCYFSCLLHLLVREGQKSREVSRSCCRWQWLPGSRCSGTRLARLLHSEKRYWLFTCFYTL